MSKYTISLKNVIEFYSRETVESWFKSYDLNDYLTSEEINVINNRGTWNKDKLAKKIVDNYYMCEIGFETPALFEHYAKITMEKIMEEKLPLIYSTAIKYDPLVNVDYTETYNRDINQTADNSGTSSSSSTNKASGLSINSDTPQRRVNKADILTGTYATSTNASETESSINDTSNTTSNGTTDTSENYTKNVKGNSGVSATAQKMIEQYRQNIIAIDRDIIDELNILFMGLF